MSGVREAGRIRRTNEGSRLSSSASLTSRSVAATWVTVSSAMAETNEAGHHSNIDGCTGEGHALRTGADIEHPSTANGPLFRFAIVGAGRVGNALAKLLCKQGGQLVEVGYRSLAASRSLAARYGARAVPFEEMSGAYDWLFLTVSDDAIATVAERLAASFAKRHDGQSVNVRYVVHTSGVHSADVLTKLRVPERRFVLAMHPLVPVTAAEDAWRVLRDAFYTLDGDKQAVSAAGMMIEGWGGRWRAIKSRHKPLYHAGAVFASNYVWTIMATALEVWSAIDLDDAGAREILLSLAGKSCSDTMRAADAGDVRAALTGPLIRTDLATLQLHLRELERLQELGSNALFLYSALGAATADKIWAGETLGERQKQVAAMMRRTLNDRVCKDGSRKRRDEQRTSPGGESA